MNPYVWAAVNVGIALGYYVLALNLARLLARYMRIRWDVRLGALVFFFTCSLTHLEHAYHVVAVPDATNAESLLALHSALIHSVQAGAVWLFVVGVVRALNRQSPELAQAQRALLAIEESDDR